MSALIRISAAGLAALVVAACNEPTPEAPARTAAPEATTPAPLPAPEPAEVSTIPEPFRGVWAATERDCDKPAETRLEITADHLRFYESSGDVASVQVKGPDEILVAVLLSGEGAASQRSFRYRLLEGGDRLFDVRNGLERARCPTA